MKERGDEMKNAWTPIKEELPDTFKIILLTAKMNYSNEPLVYMGYLSSGGVWDLFGVTNSNDYIVSAWMPLPEPCGNEECVWKEEAS